MEKLAIKRRLILEYYPVYLIVRVWRLLEDFFLLLFQMPLVIYIIDK